MVERDREMETVLFVVASADAIVMLSAAFQFFRIILVVPKLWNCSIIE